MALFVQWAFPSAPQGDCASARNPSVMGSWPQPDSQKGECAWPWATWTSLHVSQPPLLGKNRREGRGGCDTGYVERLRIRLAGLRTRGKLKKSQVRKPPGLHMHACNMQTEYVTIAWLFQYNASRDQLLTRMHREYKSRDQGRSCTRCTWAECWKTWKKSDLKLRKLLVYK